MEWISVDKFLLLVAMSLVITALVFATVGVPSVKPQPPIGE